MRYRMMTVSLIAVVTATVFQISLVSAASINPSKETHDLTVGQSTGQVPSGDTHLIPDDVNVVDGNGNYSHVKPGDWLLIPHTRTTGIGFKNIRGTKENPIIITNSGGKVRIDATGDWCGIKFMECEHVRLTGTGDPSHEYGFEVYNPDGVGVNGVNKTRYIEVDHVEIHHTGHQGICIKTDEKLRDIWVQYDTYLHHNYLHDIGHEAFYVGSSFWRDGLHPELSGVEICYNRIERTGWDGLQVGSAVADVKVHHNYLEDLGLELEPWQDSGMGINPGAHGGDWYNNLVINSQRYGIFGSGGQNYRIFNNVIVGSGTQGIQFYGNGSSVYNNTIVNSGSDGILIPPGLTSGDVYDNIVTGSGGQEIHNRGAAAVYNNLCLPSVGDVGFVDPNNNDFHLLLTSPAVDAGSDSGFAPFDFSGVSRPQGTGSDIGALERPRIFLPFVSKASLP